ncbi:integrase domain-containing protein [Roseateles chitinivorans]|uniref:integrase domain-containing protein n=1 Tax=Roseateles chitinivorans TaxID=2917965 RepID=UPI003D66DDE1
MLLKLFNAQHTSLEKTVSHKTRHDRAQFLRRFFRDLHDKAGFRQLPDPRNLGQKHLRAMVRVWQQDRLAPATIQTYLSFLRGLALWLGKPGLVRAPAFYGLDVAEYERHEGARRDRSWSAQQVNIDPLIEEICAFDRYVGASLRLIRAMGLRRKESVLFRPFACVVAFEGTGLAPEERSADRYVCIKGKGGRTRYIPLDSAARVEAVEFAQRVAGHRDAHMGDPANDLKKNLRRFDYVLSKFGITCARLGITAHGLRHETLIEHFQAMAGTPPPVRGGTPPAPALDRAARLAVSRLAGHARVRAADAYLGQRRVVRIQAASLATHPEGGRLSSGPTFDPQPGPKEAAG